MAAFNRLLAHLINSFSAINMNPIVNKSYPKLNALGCSAHALEIPLKPDHDGYIPQIPFVRDGCMSWDSYRKQGSEFCPVIKAKPQE